MLPSPPKPIAGTSRHPQRSLLALAVAANKADSDSVRLNSPDATGANAYSIDRAACEHCNAVFFPDYSAGGTQHCGLDCRTMDQVYGRLIKAAAERQRQQQGGNYDNLRRDPAQPAQNPRAQQADPGGPTLPPVEQPQGEKTTTTSHNQNPSSSSSSSSSDYAALPCVSLSPVSGAAQAATASISNNHNYNAAAGANNGPTTPLPAAATALAKTPPPPPQPSAGEVDSSSKAVGTPADAAAPGAPDSATRLRPVEASPRGSAKKLRRAENVSDDMVNALASELGGGDDHHHPEYEQLSTTGGPRSLADVASKQALRRRPSGLSLAIFADDEATNNTAAAAAVTGTPGGARSSSPWSTAAGGGSGGISRQGVGSSSSNALGVRAVSDEEMTDTVGMPLLPPPSSEDIGAVPGELQPLQLLESSSHRRVPSEPSPLSFPVCEAGTDLPPLELSGHGNGDNVARKEAQDKGVDNSHALNESSTKEAAPSEAASQNLRQ